MTCKDHCPTGMIKNEVERVCEHPLEVLSITFDRFSTHWSVGEISVKTVEC
jgi:hypothetical protein